jgi:hypothetical protein
MTQAPGGPHDGVDGESAYQASNQESTDSRQELARRIWGRYGGSPGVIPIGVTPAAARHASHFGTSQLLLLADVYRRWAPGNASPPGGWPILVYDRTPIMAGNPVPSTSQVLSFAETPPRNVGSARPTSLAGQAVALPASHAQTVEEPVRPDHPIVEKGQRRVGPPVLLSEGTLADHHAVRGGQLEAEAQVAMSAPVSSGDLGAAILRRHREGPTGGAMQRTVTSLGPAPLEGGIVGDVRLTIQPPLTLPVSSERLGASSSPTVEVPPRTVISGSLSSLTGQSGSRQSLSAQPAEKPYGGAPQISAGREAMPSAFSRDDLGAAILRRHFKTPLSWGVQHLVPSPRPPRLEGPVSATIQRSTGWPLTVPGSSAGLLHASLPLIARLLGGIPRVGIHTDAPAAAAAQALGADALTMGGDIFVSPRQADFNNPRGVALLAHELTHVAQQRRGEGESPAALEEAALANERAILHYLTAPSPIASLNSPVGRPAVPGVLSGPSFPLEGGFSAPESLSRAPLPLYPSSTPPVLAATVQRAVGPTPGPEVGPVPPAPPALPAAESPTLAAAEAASSIEVARLADQVYEMLVRRLASERERRGL